MIYLALTPAGLANARHAAGAIDSVWCGSAAVSDEEFARMQEKPSRFIYSFMDGAAADDLESATRSITPARRSGSRRCPERSSLNDR